jgi:hypothetical protein
MTSQSGESSSIIWADKVALGLALFSVLLLGALWLTAFAIVGGDGAAHLWTTYGPMSIGLLSLALMAVWLLLRTLDLLAGGSTWRLTARSAHEMAAAIAKGGSRMARLAHPHGAPLAH